MAASSPLNLLVDLHVLLGGACFGLLGAWMAKLRGHAGGARLIWIPAGKYFSTMLGLVPLGLVFERIVGAWPGTDPSAGLAWAAVLWISTAWMVSSLLEWPFFHLALRGCTTGRSLALSARANGLTLVLLAALYLPFCRLELLADRGPVTPARPLQVYYLRGEGLHRSGGKGEETLMTGLALGPESRLFARRGVRGWDLWLLDRAPTRLLEGFAPALARIPSQPAVARHLKKGVQVGEPTLAECYGKPAEGAAEAESAWALRLGRWPWEGLEVTSRGVGEPYRLALDTPLLSWAPRCATRLPGEQVLFQLGPHLWLLDLGSGRRTPFAKGQGAIAVFE